MKPTWSKRAVVAAALVLGGATLVLLVRTFGGPRYEGHSAGYWVEQLLHNDVKARSALRAIGPAAVPALAGVVGRRRGRLWRELESWRPHLPRFLARRVPSSGLDQLLQERAIEMLYEFGPRAAPAVPTLIGVDASLNDVVGYGSAGLAHATLVRIGPQGLPYFIRMLDHRRITIRIRAASYIGHLGPDAGAAAPALARTLNDPIPAVRSSAAVALSQIGPAAGAAVPALRASLKSDDDEFRLQVVRALWKVARECESTVRLLTDILGDRQNPNRAGAAMVLGEMGPAAKAAEPALSKVLTEEFSYTRVKAEEALQRIRGKRAAKKAQSKPNDDMNPDDE